MIARIAATQATTQVGDKRVHYLRTNNPLDPEVLAAYLRRIGTNRPNPYVKPGEFENVGTSDFEVFESRHCGSGVPVVSQQIAPVLESLLPAELLEDVDEFVFGATNAQSTLAPPCNQMNRHTFQGRTGLHPQVHKRP